MLRSRSLDLSFIRRGRKRSAIRTISQAILRFSLKKKKKAAQNELHEYLY